MSQISVFWPNFSYFIDKKPIKHYRAGSEYRNNGAVDFNKKGLRMNKKCRWLWIINRSIMKRNLYIDNKLFEISFILREAFFTSIELFLVYGDLRRLIRTKIIIYKQLKKLKKI